MAAVCGGRRVSAGAKKLLLLPPLSSRALDISLADTLQDLDRYSMGSMGVCGGGTDDAGICCSSTGMP